MNDLQRPLTSAPAARVEHRLLLKYIDGLHELPPTSQFLGGLSIAFRSVRLLFRHPDLLANVAIPAAINFALFAMTAGILIWNSGSMFSALWAQPEGWLVALWWFARILVVPMLLLISYFATLILGAIVASPFNETLSGKVEHILRGDLVDVEGGLKGNAIGAARGVATSVLTASCYLLCMTPIVVIGLIPGIGSIIATVLGGAVSSFFLAVEYTDHPLERRMYSFKQKLMMIWNHRPLAAGYGLGTSFLLWIPLLNFLCMPIAVIGGTALGLSLDGTAEQENADDDA